MIQLDLPDDNELETLRQEFDETGRCSIQSILPEEHAETLASFLENYSDWCRMRGFQGQRYDMGPESQRDTDPAVIKDHQTIEKTIAENSGNSFAYLYDAIPMLPEQLDMMPDNPLVELRQAMTDPSVFHWMEKLSGETGLSGIEVQATRFRAGDFLSVHHDGPNVDRKIAMVLGLSHDWAVDWGGNLLFPCADDRVEGLSPGFNRLDLFGVPQFHCVTSVASAAPRPRHAFSGWYLG